MIAAETENNFGIISSLNKEKTCYFDGYVFMSNLGKEPILRAKEFLLQAVQQAINEGCTTFVAAGSYSNNLLFAEIVFKLKEDYPYIELIMSVPRDGDFKQWLGTDKRVERYKGICGQASCIITADTFQVTDDDYFRYDCLRDAIVRSKILIALYDGRTEESRKYIRDFAEENNVLVCGMLCKW